MVVPFTEELTVMPVAFPKTYILPGQPNFKDTEESEYLFQSLLESSLFAIIACTLTWRPISCMAQYISFADVGLI